MANHFCTYILNIYRIWKHILSITFLNELSSFLHTVKWFQVLLYNSYNSTSVICLHAVCSILPIDRTLSSATLPGQCRPGSNGNEGVLHIHQKSKARALPSNGLMTYPGHLLGVSYPSSEMQSVNSYSPTADWAVKVSGLHMFIFIFFVLFLRRVFFVYGYIWY